MTDKSKTQLEAAAKVEDAEKALTAITETEKGIAILKKQYDGVIFEVGTTDGMMDARKARQEIRAPRYTIENLRKAAKAPILALGRTVDSIAADLTKQLRDIEYPIDVQIKAEETRKAEEKRIAAEKEETRVRKHRDRIDAMVRAIDQVCADHKLTPEAVKTCIEIHEKAAIGDDFEEFTEEAQLKWGDGLTRLQQHHGAMTDRVMEEERQAERDAELEQLRKEKEERDRKDAEEAERQRKEEQRKADIKAELDRKAAAIKPVEEQLAPQIPYVDKELAQDLIGDPSPDHIPYVPPVGPADPVAGSYVRPEIPANKLQEKMQSLMYALTKNAARTSYADFLEDLDISDDEYDQIKTIWKEKLGIKPYV